MDPNLQAALDADLPEASKADNDEDAAELLAEWQQDDLSVFFHTETGWPANSLLNGPPRSS